MSIFVLWGTVRPQWARMRRRLAGAGQTDHHDLIVHAPNPSAFRALVHDLYPDADRGHIANKAEALLAAGPPILLAVRCRCGDARALKEELRAMADVPDPLLACHASDSTEEEAYLEGVLFSCDNGWYIHRRKSPLPRPEFLELLDRLGATLRDFGIGRREACIVGGAVLEACELRECTDIDITVTAAHRKRFGPGSQALAPGIDLVTEGYHRRVIAGLEPVFTDDELIQNGTAHFYRLGYKFASLHIVGDRKRHDERQQDRADADMIDMELGRDERLPYPSRHR